MNSNSQSSSSHLNHSKIINSLSQNTHTKIPKMITLSVSPQEQSLMFRKRQWTQKEDQILLKAINHHGPRKWGLIAQSIPNRVGKQCRERWHNHLNPNINKTQWTPQQEWMLYLLFLIYGGKWAKMTQILTLRTDNSIKNHWNSIMKKKIPLLQQRLLLILSQQQQNSGEFNQQQKGLLQKIKQKFYKKQDNTLITQNSALLTKEQINSQRLSSCQQSDAIPEQFEQNNQQFTTKKSQFQVNIDLRSQSQNLPLRETLINQQRSNVFSTFTGKYKAVQDMNKENSGIFVSSNFQSSRDNFSGISFQRVQSAEFQLFPKKSKTKSQFCNSPKLKARYSQILVDNSDMNEDKEDQKVFHSIFSDCGDTEICLKRRLSRNISIISPTKFIEKQNSV